MSLNSGSLKENTWYHTSFRTVRKVEFRSRRESNCRHYWTASMRNARLQRVCPAGCFIKGGAFRHLKFVLIKLHVRWLKRIRNTNSENW